MKLPAYFARAGLVAALLLDSSAAFAFGEVGHRVIAEIASRHLKPPARAEVERLLDDRAGHALRDWSTWPDEMRALEPYRPLAALHYVNFGGGACRYDAARDCADGRCIVAGLDGFVRTLEQSDDDRARAEALKWVIHLVGDVHMPLHASSRPDKGGNDVQVRFRGAGTNLHTLWDSRLLETRGRDPVRHADRVERGPAPRDLAWSPDAPARWAEASCRVAEASIYPRGNRIDEAYVEAGLALVDARLHEAGLRLAEVLNRVLAAPGTRPVQSAPRTR